MTEIDFLKIARTSIRSCIFDIDCAIARIKSEDIRSTLKCIRSDRSDALKYITRRLGELGDVQ